jgi:hypothetical protein
MPVCTPLEPAQSQSTNQPPPPPPPFVQVEIGASDCAADIAWVELTCQDHTRNTAGFIDFVRLVAELR